ncbi:hypothetical protein EZJ19_03785 [Parasulfuritortus cantonensis]|uniref:Histidine kinase n=1 Tax=Parasulfuritortus cantonensis TaxID=2528202 RepID=A0A4R1BL24_9PROT|nr:FIST N-terminal domain-containing protein [Parasulfuritortus cantonensis]TCJ18036.1 hypothetical protein EZJ19_03785 [Parasulfuritortus cantonensis]
MRTEQLHWTGTAGWNRAPARADAGLVLIFGGTDVLTGERLAELRAFYPAAILLGCSTAGEILDTRVYDDSLAVTAVTFADTRLRLATRAVASAADSRPAGAQLAGELLGSDLRHVFLLSDGLAVNGTELVEGLKSVLPPGIEVTGGLSGDGARFQRTLVVADGAPEANRIAALGLYGSALQVGFGSLGGWDPFGPDRLITKAQGNVLYELDGQSALGLYKKYLGGHAAGLPATALLFPLALSAGPDQNTGPVRTVLAVDEAAQSMTFAGDMPEGMYVRLMKANFERLVDGAAGAAEHAGAPLAGAAAELAVLISCVGRKLVLKQRVEEEVEAVREVLGPKPALAGFYSYGEISPHVATARCELHNQTMTITTFREAAPA